MWGRGCDVMEEERWMWVVGYKGRYRVSTLGRVESVTRTVRAGWGSLRRQDGRVLRSAIASHGYPMVVLRDGTEGKAHTVHTIVLTAFVGPCPSGMLCRHLDGNKTNNVLSNLVWGTHEENYQDAVRHGRVVRHSGEKSPNCKLTDAEIVEIRRLVASKEMTKRAIAKKYGIHRVYVRQLELREWRKEASNGEGTNI